jgi:purine-cytosine permease-like protein
MTDFNTLTRMPFGWNQVFIFYFLFFIFYFLFFIFSDIVCSKKINELFNKKK